MPYSEKSVYALRTILGDMEVLNEGKSGFMQENLLCIDRSLKVFEDLTAHKPTENHYDHVVNYCRIKMQFAKQQIERGTVEEGVGFAKAVIWYYLRESNL
ncbi:hypothetical protein TH61_13100 [Rufibacter sp. DG15C]|uniref:hypothetical protein n=1 Tax=Rufibacter sp. DG15C TaxID=1379909 RepID=UPI00078E8481|nr:hypothetical protein [Rufibacter sp. DG15C]AMM51932.1 hypothetical protein TH61_13100 [Rufibacter sp. DG15C]